MNARMTGAPVKRSVTIAGHRTSISLEPEFWDALCDIANAQNRSVNGLIAEIDTARPATGQQTNGLSSAVRRYVLAYYRKKALTPR